MKRNPILQAKKDYYDSLSVHQIFPLLFYHTCCKCGLEYKLEKMFESSNRDAYFSMTHYHTGCKHCFKDKDDFKEYVKNNIMVPESNWEFDGKPVNPMQKAYLSRLSKSNNT